MDRYALGLVAALLTLWGAGAIYQGYPDRLAEGLIGACLLLAAVALWLVVWWRITPRSSK